MPRVLEVAPTDDTTHDADAHATSPAKTSMSLHLHLPWSTGKRIERLVEGGAFASTKQAAKTLLTEGLDARAKARELSEGGRVPLTCSVPVDVAARIRERATEQGLTVEQWLSARALGALMRSEPAPKTTPPRPRQGPYTGSPDEDAFVVPSGDVLPSTERRKARDGHSL